MPHGPWYRRRGVVPRTVDICVLDAECVHNDKTPGRVPQWVLAGVEMKSGVAFYVKKKPGVF